MWSHVKFTGDGIVHNVQTSFFKVVVEGKAKPKDLKINDLYLVFWSPDPKDSPQKIIGQGNDIVEMSSNRRGTNKKAGPLKGYYEAMLLDLKESEDSFDEVSKTATTSSSRVRIPTPKAMAAADQTIPRTSKSIKQMERDKKKNETLAAQEASKLNLHTMIDMFKPPMPAAQDTKQQVKEASSSEDSVADSSDSEGEDDEYWKKKFLALQKEMEKAKKSKKKKDKKGTKSSDDSCSKKKKKVEKPENTLTPASLSSKEVPQPKVENPDNTLTPASLSSKEASPGTDFTTGTKDDSKTGGKSSSAAGPSGGVPSDGASKQTDDEMDGDLGDQDPWGGDDDDDTFVVIKKRRIKPGPAGDSLFCFNTAATLWKPEEMAVRSTSGLPSNRSDSAAYPKLTPSKVKKVSRELASRIREEEPNVSDADVKKRVEKVKGHLGQKISAVRRSLRSKGHVIPTAAEYLKQKKEEEKKNRKEEGGNDSDAY